MGLAREADRPGLSLRAKSDLRALPAQTAPPDREENLDLRDTLVLRALRCVGRARGGGRGPVVLSTAITLGGGGPCSVLCRENADVTGADLVVGEACPLPELTNSLFIDTERIGS